MRLSLFWLCISILLISCRSPLKQEDLVHLNGYWEIDRVEFPDGAEKNYGSNTTLDYIKIEGFEGFRKKAYPKIDGTFQVTDDAELFKISQMESEFYMNYQNELSQWQELLKDVSRDRFSVVNEENITYYYKRYEPISLE
ncbi:hypothetical protein [Poritiphilus flavus]|uniref:Lipocalin-like domain-containing protein n=1 Tax=Poritiphilus flavus TaxID=2697053 RepID=A0A6L9E9I6_9FLAO|nr:hypothetical protein [Poritiphilus flavus]NAS11390.1 hypothetical protein [Poritiphilus flavus]